MLGPLEVDVDGAALSIGSRKERALLALLALRPQRSVGSGDLIDGLWGEEPPLSSSKGLQMHVSNLRRLLPAGTIRTTPSGYALEVDPAAIDAHRFESLAKRGRQLVQDGQAGSGSAVLSQALGLWRGRCLPDLLDHPFGVAEAARLEELRRTVEEDLAAARLGNGEHHAMAGDLEAAVAAEPLRERRWAQLMLALYRSGRQAEALRTYQRLRDHLVEELGIDPSAELTALEQAILNQNAELDWVPADAHTSLPPTLSSPAPLVGGQAVLPAEASDLVGRDEIVAEVIRSLRDHRLVTLWGAGGIGKTRVAVRVAARTSRQFDDGARFADLSVLGRSGRVADVVLTTFHATATAGEPSHEAVVRVLRPARLLLVLDNCEHVIEEARELVAQLVASCPWVHVLTTSREALALPDERRIDVPPLDVPDHHVIEPEVIRSSPSVRLFADRARIADRSFALDEGNVGVVADICRQVGGFPLAIELAAARLDVETAGELSGDTPEANLLRRLESDRGDQHRLRSVFGSLRWSFDLLSGVEQRLFSTLGVFAGPFTREMAMELAQAGQTDDQIHAFDRLVRTSMVMRDAPGSARFRMFPPAKEFALATLSRAEVERLSRRHAALMVERAERFAPLIHTDGELRACGVLVSDYPDSRQAVNWLLAHGLVEDAARLVVALFQFCHFQMLSEAHGWAMQLVDSLEPSSPLLAEVCGAAALGAWFEGDTDRAIILGERAVGSLDFAREPRAFWAHLALIDAYSYTDRLAEGFEHFRAFVSETRSSGDPFWQITGLGYEALAFQLFGRLKDAHLRVEQATALARQLNNPDCIHWALYCLGRVVAADDPEAASEAFEQSIDATRRVGSRWNLSLGLLAWASVRRTLGDSTNAAQALLEVLDLLSGAGNRSQLSETFLESALLLAEHGDAELAYLTYQSRFGLPEMPRANDDPLMREAFGQMLASQVGPARSRLAIRARSIPEHDLIVRCRSALESIVASGRAPAGGAPPKRLPDVVVVCTDLVASTELNVEVGDNRYVELLREHNSIVRHRIAQFNGMEFAFTGDGVAVMFADVDEALRFGMGLQADLDDVGVGQPGSLFRVRIGMARGEVIENDGTLIGQTVVRAVRVCAAASAGQLLAGEDVTETVNPSSATFELVGHVPLKGFGISVPLYQARSLTAVGDRA